MFLKILPFLLLLLNATQGFSAAIDLLNPDQRAQLLTNGKVVIATKIANKPWPRVQVFQIIEGSPEESAAITMDWELKTNYTPRLKLSKISKIIDATTADVDYSVSVPILGDERFTMRNKISGNDNSHSYRIEFNLVRAEHISESHGETLLEPLGEKTLMVLDTFTDPNRMLASKVAGLSVRQTIEACDAFGDQVRRERSTNRVLLEKQISALREALTH